MQEFGAYDPKAGPRMIAACEARADFLRRHQAEWRAESDRIGRDIDEYKAAMTAQGAAFDEVRRLKSALDDAETRLTSARDACRMERAPGSADAGLPACREDARLETSVLPSRREGLDKAMVRLRAATGRLPTGDAWNGRIEARDDLRLRWRSTARGRRCAARDALRATSPWASS